MIIQEYVEKAHFGGSPTESRYEYYDNGLVKYAGFCFSGKVNKTEEEQWVIYYYIYSDNLRMTILQCRKWISWDNRASPSKAWATE